jgi:hypothetical protein
VEQKIGTGGPFAGSGLFLSHPRTQALFCWRAKRLPTIPCVLPPPHNPLRKDAQDAWVRGCFIRSDLIAHYPEWKPASFGHTVHHSTNHFDEIGNELA